MSYNNISGEPAFLANQKVTTAKSRGIKRSLADCCYSFSNLVIIFACVIGFYFTLKFINDDPLYDYGEHLLTLRFYRQLIYVIVVFPLLILVPLFNAFSVCFSGSRKSSFGQASLIAKIIYQVFVALLAFIGLIFVAPSIKYSSLVKQIDYEFKRHMKFRYDKDFSYVFLDRIQQEYDCCDEDWYRANYNDKIPLSCYTDELEFSQLHKQTCPEAIGSIVSTRCSIIAACLVTILIAMAILVALDVPKLISAKENYDVGTREQALIASAGSIGGTKRNGNSLPGGFKSPSSAGTESVPSDDDDDDDDDGGFNKKLQPDQNRLRSNERRQERPLLINGGRTSPLAEPEPDLDLDYYNNPSGTCSPAAILTRANYIAPPAGSRPKSPVFVTSSPANSAADRDTGGSSPVPPKGVLKKTSSLSRSIDRVSLAGRVGEEELVDESIEQVTSFESYQRQLQQSLHNQRPLFNVRFAE